MMSKKIFLLLSFVTISILIITCKPTTREEKTSEKIMNCDDKNENTKDYFDEQKKQCVNEKILFSKTLKPSSILCGTKVRPPGEDKWVSMPTNCSDKLAEKDSNFYTIEGKDIKLKQISAVELKFDLNDPEIKEIVSVKTKIDMVCKFSLSLFTLTEFNEWKPTPDFYFHCQEWTKDRKVAEIVPSIKNGIAYVLITPGTGDSVGEIDSAVLEVSFYRS